MILIEYKWKEAIPIEERDEYWRSYRIICCCLNNVSISKKGEKRIAFHREKKNSLSKERETVRHTWQVLSTMKSVARLIGQVGKWERQAMKQEK